MFPVFGVLVSWSESFPFFCVDSIGLDWIAAAQSVSGGLVAGATEARALRAGAPNLRQAVESR
jgi:hypothetical protein